MSYQIVDEPGPTNIAHLAVQPVWPLFGLMLAGSWLGLPWLVVNAFAIGCPNRMRALYTAIGAFVGRAIIIALIIFFANTFQWNTYAVKYALLADTIWVLGTGYYLYVLQSRTFELYTYFNGQVRNGIMVVFLAALLKSKILGALPPLFQLVLQ